MYGFAFNYSFFLQSCVITFVFIFGKWEEMANDVTGEQHRHGILEVYFRTISRIQEISISSPTHSFSHPLTFASAAAVFYTFCIGQKFR